MKIRYIPIGEKRHLRIPRSTIMVVDDEQDIRESFAVILEDKYDLAMAESGEEALVALQNRRDISMVFLDYKLPGMNGLELLKILEHQDIRVPVVMVTGRGTREIAARAFQCHVHDYIVKPFRVKEVEEAVAKILGERPSDGDAAPE
jgi:DNA-binding NtrC family response regulator